MRPDFMQQALKFTVGTAWTEIVSTKLLLKLFISVDNSITLFNPGLGWESFTTLA